MKWNQALENLYFNEATNEGVLKLIRGSWNKHGEAQKKLRYNLYTHTPEETIT